MGEAVWAHIQCGPNTRTIGKVEPGEIVKLWLAFMNGKEAAEGFWSNIGPHHSATLYPEEVSHWMPYTTEKPAKPT